MVRGTGFDFLGDENVHAERVFEPRRSACQQDCMEAGIAVGHRVRQLTAHSERLHGAIRAYNDGGACFEITLRDYQIEAIDSIRDAASARRQRCDLQLLSAVQWRGVEQPLAVGRVARLRHSLLLVALIKRRYFLSHQAT